MSLQYKRFVLLFGSIAVIAIAGCTFETNFLKHTLTVKEKGRCSDRTAKVAMVSNTNGQRYSFDYCLPPTTGAPVYTVVRKGDTLDVQFAQKGEVLYDLTLDIDANPAYRFIRLGDQVVAVIPGNY
jgi:hypothetical protein